jgi:hypothetical protein
MNWIALLIYFRFYLYMCLHPFVGVLRQRDVTAGELDVSVMSVMWEAFDGVDCQLFILCI